MHLLVLCPGYWRALVALQQPENAWQGLMHSAVQSGHGLYADLMRGVQAVILEWTQVLPLLGSLEASIHQQAPRLLDTCHGTQTIH